MRKMLIPVLLIVFSLAFAVAAQQATKLEDPPWIKEVAPQRIVYSVPGMERIKARKDLVYKRAGNSEMKMDVYSPPGSSNRKLRPAVIFIHGGAVPPNLRTTVKEWGAFVSYGQLAAASGLVGVTFNHRFYSWDSLADSQADVDDAIKYVRDNAASLGVDKDRICLWAFSGGGPFLSHAMRDTPPYVRCLVSYYAFLDLQQLPKEITKTATDEALKEHSPLRYLSSNGKKIAPMFIARAGRDLPALNASVDRFVQEAVAKGLTLDLINHAEGEHAFDVLNNDDRSREILKRTIDFIKARL